MMNRPKVFLTGGDNRGWALDMVLETNRRALEGIVEFADLESCDVVHSVWWEAVARLQESALDGKRIVSYVPGEPFRFLADPSNPLAMRRVGKWIVGTAEALRQFRSIGIDAYHVPFLVDTGVFVPVPKGDARLEETPARYTGKSAPHVFTCRLSSTQPWMRHPPRAFHCAVRSLSCDST